MAKRTLSRFSTTQLHLELKRRQRDMVRLETKRNKLAKELGQVEKQIDAFGGTVAAAPAAPAKRPVGRPKGSTNKKRGRKPGKKMTLYQALEKALAGKTLSVTEATGEAKKVGYKTKAANFRTIVNQTLIKNPTRFKKVSRGMYTLNG